jgi:hypothetical protein
MIYRSSLEKLIDCVLTMLTELGVRIISRSCAQWRIAEFKQLKTLRQTLCNASRIVGQFNEEPLGMRIR